MALKASQAWARARPLGAIDLNSAEPKERHLLRRWRCFSSVFAWNHPLIVVVVVDSYTETDTLLYVFSVGTQA
jgi:hypothetical protein